MSAAAASDTGQRRPSRRRLARVGAVQALYQAELNGQPLETVAAEFRRHRLGKLIDDFPLDPDRAFFGRLIAGIGSNRAMLDEMLGQALTTGRGSEQLEAVLRAILLSGAYELFGEADVPARVVIDEYVDITGDFFGQREASLANGVLDRLAKVLRPDEF